MHTPDNARKLWCPMVRIARRESLDQNAGELRVVGGCNTDALGKNRVPASCKCVAETCAMWRWLPKYDYSDKPGPGDAAGKHALYRPKLLPSTHGYCGLAARPEILNGD